jgi:hypothetical protein|tara:strand:- start:6133 stop:6333 length:201 start_codon:yes stop_codon:yes gene_type:complete
MSGDFLHILKPNERRMLRTIVKKVNFQHYPKEFITDREADKFISVLGPVTVEKLLKVGKDNKIDSL